MANIKEILANEMDRKLDTIARHAHYQYEADGDQRWRDLYMKIDAARGAAQRLMSQKDLEKIKA